MSSSTTTARRSPISRRPAQLRPRTLAAHSATEIQTRSRSRSRSPPQVRRVRARGELGQEDDDRDFVFAENELLKHHIHHIHHIQQELTEMQTITRALFNGMSDLRALFNGISDLQSHVDSAVTQFE